jgi:hypothetical protein
VTVVEWGGRDRREIPPLRGKLSRSGRDDTKKSSKDRRKTKKKKNRTLKFEGAAPGDRADMGCSNAAPLQEDPRRPVSVGMTEKNRPSEDHFFG